MRQPNCTAHEGHSHRHGPGCGHPAVQHGDHVDYLHEGHLHHLHDDHVDEHVVPVSAANAAACTPQHRCGTHAGDHVHGPQCGHAQIPHGDHVDYLVKDHLHHPHGDHCDDHGAVAVRS
jgi:hypothetical protein